jgi:hypothetical protein
MTTVKSKSILIDEILNMIRDYTPRSAPVTFKVTSERAITKSRGLLGKVSTKLESVQVQVRAFYVGYVIGSEPVSKLYVDAQHQAFLRTVVLSNPPRDMSVPLNRELLARMELRHIEPIHTLLASS